MLATSFAAKMTVAYPGEVPPSLPRVTKAKINSSSITVGEVYQALKALEEDKAVCPDNISPRLLRQCASELALPLSKLLTTAYRRSLGLSLGRPAMLFLYTRRTTKQT